MTVLTGVTMRSRRVKSGLGQTWQRSKFWCQRTNQLQRPSEYNLLSLSHCEGRRRDGLLFAPPPTHDSLKLLLNTGREFGKIPFRIIESGVQIFLRVGGVVGEGAELRGERGVEDLKELTKGGD